MKYDPVVYSTTAACSSTPVASAPAAFPDRAQPPAVSVVVPVFGTEPELPACLASILAQSFRDFEVIVVDDGSPGDTAGVVARVHDPEGRIRLLRHPENRGEIAARHTGATVARGTYLAFIDSDDQLAPAFLGTMIAAARAHDVDLVECAIDHRRLDGGRELWRPDGPSHAPWRGSPLPEFLAGRIYNSLCNKLFRAAWVRGAMAGIAARSRRVDFAPDLLVMFEALQSCTSYVKIDEPLYRYIARPGSATTASGPDAARRRYEDLSAVYATIAPRLAACAEPEPLKRHFFQREFVCVFRDLLRSLGQEGAALPRWPATGTP